MYNLSSWVDGNFSCGIVLSEDHMSFVQTGRGGGEILGASITRSATPYASPSYSIQYTLNVKSSKSYIRFLQFVTLSSTAIVLDFEIKVSDFVFTYNLPRRSSLTI